MLLVHGLAEHSERYLNMAGYFVSRGYAVYGLDHRGHGKSDGLRGYVERFSHYLSDLKTFFDIVRPNHGEAGVFMVGHSMGGTIAAAYAVRHQNELDGLIVSGATLKVGASVSAALIMVARLLSLLLPKTGLYVIEAAAISRDQAVVNAYINDPLVYRGKIRARLGAELIRVMQELRQQMPKIGLPLLIMHGTADRLSDPRGSRMLYQGAGSRDKTLKLYDGFHHEIFNEPEKGRVLADMESWLAAHT